MKKAIAFALAALTAAFAFTACTSGAAEGEGSLGAITVVSREDGSGTRGAFIELTGVEVKNDAGEKEDMTTEDAVVVNSTSVVMTTVAGDVNAIGYISLGSLDDSVTAVDVDGAPATVEAIKDGSYKVARNFNVVTKGELANEAAADFLGFILSAEGQAVVEDNKYIAAVEDAPAYAGDKPSGKVVVAGSSSVTPVMEKLAEAYKILNPNVEIEIQMSDSSTGISSAIDGICDIGMASRALKDSELDAGLTPTVIATDGIAVVVNNANPNTGLTAEQIRQIFTGEITAWDEI